MKIQLVNPKTGIVEDIKFGFSWTVLFFGFFPAIFRRDWKWAAAIALATGITLCVANIVIAFLYNKNYILDRIDEGYYPANAESLRVLVANRYVTEEIFSVDNIS